ncbi:10479_t:CDS:2 [Dentiscutata erythropus]|uniref:10479_t:CDS:1 n=1 Tax=Dentiscutata erythropus TaxID=1348616 RepID=A0A9N9GYE0_9GLOM|nr:10479_t:CDS:2 [Dentiscutata erythropus]
MVNDNSQIKKTNNKEKEYQVEFLQENPETQIAAVEEIENEYIQNTGPEDEVQPMELDEVYLIDIPQWGELTTGLEFEETNEYHENAADYSDLFPGIPGMNFNSEDWSQPMDTYIDWEYYDFQ